MDNKNTNKKNKDKKDIMTNEKSKNEIKEDIKTTKKRSEIEEKKNKENKHIVVHFFLFVVLILAIIYFIVNLFFNKNNSNIDTLINSLLILLFTVVYVAVAFTTNRKNKSMILFSSFLLLAYFGYGIVTNLNFINISDNTTVKDFSNKSLTEVMKWAAKNNVEIKQEYEYSDMVSEYEIISQDIKAGTKLEDVKELTVAVSEGPNPNKEVVVPNMISWNVDKVTDFVLKNYLTNVEVEFVESDKAQDTVIEQSKSGNLERDEKLKLTFSYGEELGFSEVKLIDFTNKTKFEVELYLKQHHILYQFDRDYSDDIKRDLVMKQSIKAGKMVKVENEDEKVIVTFSKGAEIKVPELTKMDLTEITDWVIKNRLKLEFSDKYDAKVKENNIISASHKKGDIIEQGTTIKVVISKGSLKMPNVKSYDEFREWADKYDVKYEEKHEFNEDIPSGEVISYSYKKGEIIKNDDVIMVIISDGVAIKVPNLVGLSKNDAASKLKKLGLNYNFVYKNSNSVAEGKVISQSMSAGSEISKNTTITITVSSGKAKEVENKNNNSNNSSSSSTSTCDKSKTGELNIQAGSSGAQTKAIIQQMNPNHKFNFVFVEACDNGDSSPGTVCTLGLEGSIRNFCDTITIKVVK